MCPQKYEEDLFKDRKTHKDQNFTHWSLVQREPGNDWKVIYNRFTRSRVESGYRLWLRDAQKVRHSWTKVVVDSSVEGNETVSATVRVTQKFVKGLSVTWLVSGPNDLRSRTEWRVLVWPTSVRFSNVSLKKQRTTGGKQLTWGDEPLGLRFLLFSPLHKYQEKELKY